VPWRLWRPNAEPSILDPRVRFVRPRPEAKKIAGAHGAQDFIVGRIDSDDMLGPEALEALEGVDGVDATKPYLQLFTGCAFEEARNLVRHWRNPSPAFVFRPVSAADLTAGFPSLGGKHSHVHRESVHVHTGPGVLCRPPRNQRAIPPGVFAKGGCRSAERDIRARFNLPTGQAFSAVTRFWS
jgi:hypothetical protein